MLFTGRGSFLILLFSVLMVLTVWLGVSVFSSWPFVTAEASEAADTSIRPSVQSGLVQLATVRNAHLFGSDSAKPERIFSAPKTRSALPLSLLGVVAGYEGRSVAMLKVNGKQFAFKEGAVLPLNENVVVAKVGSDRVTIARDGVEEILYLEKINAVPGLSVSE